jgi:hypothetical protein
MVSSGRGLLAGAARCVSAVDEARAFIFIFYVCAPRISSVNTGKHEFAEKRSGERL